MDKRITLNKLLSFVSSISINNDQKKDSDNKDNYEISSQKNDRYAQRYQNQQYTV